MNATNEVLIVRVKGGLEEEVLDEVASETAFTLQVNGTTLVSLLCSPSELDCMAVGFLLSEGILPDRDSLQTVAVDAATSSVSVTVENLPDDWQSLINRKTITSGCGQGVTFSDARNLRTIPRRTSPFTLSSLAMQDMLRDFRNISDLYIRTGGVHTAAFTDGREILLFSEDIGRHNAVDKLIGKAFLTGIAMHDKILLSSGRISGEIMTKVIRNNIPVLISRTAPTCMSITHAEQNGVTLIGFARGNRMNIYTHPQNIVIETDGALAAPSNEPPAPSPQFPGASADEHLIDGVTP